MLSLSQSVTHARVASVCFTNALAASQSAFKTALFAYNRSHGMHEEKAKLVLMIREVEEKYRHPIGILADLQVTSCLLPNIQK